MARTRAETMPARYRLENVSFGDTPSRTGASASRHSGSRWHATKGAKNGRVSSNRLRRWRAKHASLRAARRSQSEGMTIRLAVSPLPLLILLAASVVVATTAAGSSELRAILAAPNADGVAITLIAGESATSEHPFFRSLGSGGRACATCHVPSQGWTL